LSERILEFVSEKFNENLKFVLIKVANSQKKTFIQTSLGISESK
jgi:hypothetical protein